MDEDKIPKKGILENTSSALQNENVLFEVPKKEQELLITEKTVSDLLKKDPVSSNSEGIVFDVPQKNLTPDENTVLSTPQEKEIGDTKTDLKTNHLPEQSKTLIPTIDITNFPSIENPLPHKENNEKISITHISTTTEPEKTPLPQKTNPPESKIQENADQSDIPTLRTYKKDVSGAVKDQKTSLVRMVLEEQKGRYRKEAEESPKSRKNITLIFLSVLFLFITSGIIYYTFFVPSKGQQLLAEIKVIPLISTEEIQELSIDKKSSKDIAKEIQQQITSSKSKLDIIKYFFFTKKIPTQTDTGLVEKKILVGAQEFFEKLEIPVPQIILRTVKDDFMFGYHTFNGNQPFLILKTDYYDNAFVGMIGWEEVMAQDLKPLFGTIGTGDPKQRTWSDLITKNKDTRVLYNSDGGIALVYMFQDQRTLIITTNNNTLFEISRRLEVELKKK